MHKSDAGAVILTAAAKKKPQAVTHSELVSKLAEIVTTVSKWLESDKPTKEWPPNSGRIVKVLDQPTAEALELLEQIVEPSVRFGASAYRLVLSIDAVVEEYETWLQTLEFDPVKADPAGGPTLWILWEHLINAMTPAIYPMPEPVSQLLHRDRVSAQQVAVIYGWRTAAGAPDVNKVFEEAEKPGTHFDPKKWVHPSAEFERKREAEAWEERRKRKPIGRGRTDNRAASEAPETVEELLRQNVSVEQIARMKKIEVGDVLRIANEANILSRRSTPVMPGNPSVAHENRQNAEADAEAEYAKSQ